MTPVQYGILLAFALMPAWLKWPFAPAPFTPLYSTGFILTSLMMVVFFGWIAGGCRGWRRLIASRWHVAWVIFAITLLIWGGMSQFWAFGRETYPGMAQNAVVQWLIVLSFTIVVIASAPPRWLVLAVLVVSMLIHGSIGGLQVILQDDIGLRALGEFALDVSRSGVSVLETGQTRWLRPYGLLPHPNMLAGMLIPGLFAASLWVFQAQRGRVLMPLFTVGIGFWYLLLTFSRGAWLGFAGGALLTLPLLFRIQHFWRRFAQLIVILFGTGLLFVLIFHPLLLSRVGFNQENTEQRSIADRLVYIEVAQDAIATYPLQGVGIGNFPWYASNYIYFNTRYDLRGDNVHNIYLGVTAELGLIGLVLFGGLIISGIGAALRNINPERSALLAAFIAWAIIGLVDHYTWTLIITQAHWFGILGMAMSDD